MWINLTLKINEQYVENITETAVIVVADETHRVNKIFVFILRLAVRHFQVGELSARIFLGLNAVQMDKSSITVNCYLLSESLTKYRFIASWKKSKITYCKTAKNVLRY
jgi:hypothetical protein